MASALYISFAIAAGGFRPALSLGGVGLPFGMPGCPTLARPPEPLFETRPPTKLQEKQTGVLPANSH